MNRIIFGLLGLLLSLCSVAQNMITVTNPASWSTITNVTITSGIVDFEKKSTGYRLVISSTTGSISNSQSGLTPGQWIRNSFYIRKLSTNTAAATIKIYYGDSIGKTTDITGVITTSWQRISADIESATATTGLYGIVFTGTSGDGVEISHTSMEPVSVMSRKIVTLGDSYSTAPYHYAHYINMLSPLGVTAKGVGGQTCATIASRVQSDLISRIPLGLGIILCGINDIVAASSDPTSSLMTSVDTIVRAMQTAGIRPLIITLTPFGNASSWTSGRQVYLENYNAQLLAYAKYNGIDIFDAYNDGCRLLVALTTECDGGDGLHRSLIGYGTMGRGVSELINRMSGL